MASKGQSFEEWIKHRSNNHFSWRLKLCLVHSSALTGLTVCLGDALKSLHGNAARSFLNVDSVNVVFFIYLGCLALRERVLSKLQSQFHRRRLKHDSDAQQLLPVCLKCDASQRLDLTHLPHLSLARQEAFSEKNKIKKCESLSFTFPAL